MLTRRQPCIVFETHFLFVGILESMYCFNEDNLEIILICHDILSSVIIWLESNTFANVINIFLVLLFCSDETFGTQA